MLTFFRRVSKSKIGTWIMALLLVAILAGFAVADISNFGSGKIGFGLGSSTLAKVGDQDISEREMSEAMQRRLQEVRQQKPDADYATIAGDFNAILDGLIDQRTLLAFADKFGFPVSKRLIDAEIAQIPQTKGLNGQFSEQAYQGFLAQQRLTDSGVRQILMAGLLQRMVLTPVATNARVSVGMATPFASMLLDSREGEAAIIPVAPFRAGLSPTDASLQQFYSANRARYMIPEQRIIRFARIGPDQVAGVTASEQDIAAYYNANKASYAAKDTRSLTQVIAPDQAIANAIAQRARGGATLAAAAAPAGNNASLTTLADQSREAYAGVAGDKAAAAVFGAASGAIVGPVHSDFGWIVAKVDAVKTIGGKTLDQARGEIAAKLTADKRKQAIEDIVDKVQNAVDDGSNFNEAVNAARLQVTQSPLVTANGTSRIDAAFKLPTELAPALKTGFEIAPNDPPEIVSLPNNQGYAVVSPSQVVAAAPTPLASIRDQVANDWINDQALKRARAAAAQVVAKASGGATLADALKGVGIALPQAQPIAARRIQLASAQGGVPPAMKMLFTLQPGKSGMGADPQGRGFYVVKVTRAVPGNALLQPGLIGQMQNELQDAMAQDYAREFLTGLKKELKAKRNESAIQAFKTRLTTSGG